MLVSVVERIGGFFMTIDSALLDSIVLLLVYVLKGTKCYHLLVVLNLDCAITTFFIDDPFKLNFSFSKNTPYISTFLTDALVLIDALVKIVFV